MPRSQKAVKKKPTLLAWDSPGVVDLHFHGALGIDLVTATPAQCTALAQEMAQAGIAAFCPTLLSLEPEPLREAVARLGAWVSESKKDTRPGSALPLGLHLEGPFLSPHARGAHPEGAIQPFDLEELESLRQASRDQIRIVTLAPEEIPAASLEKLRVWANRHRVHLSMGHSQATQAQAREALNAGFNGVTHAWNAMAFHHREPGLLGAALGSQGVAVEVIPDGIHVNPAIVRWVVELHRAHGAVCFVSDCVPAAATAPGTGPYPFGPDLRVSRQDGASQLEDGTLAGGGHWLPQALAAWLNAEGQRLGFQPQDARKAFKTHWRHVFDDPLSALGVKPATIAKRAKIHWTWDPESGLVPTAPKPLLDSPRRKA